MKHLIALMLLSWCLIALAHPGGRDAAGCHTCRTHCSQHGLQDGERHCHTQNTAPEPEQPAEILRLDYTGGFTVWIDCSRRGAVKFRYNARRDQGNIKRLNDFFIDPDVPERCKQTSTKSYKL